MKSWPVIVGCALCLLGAGCERKAEPDVLARVGTREIHAQDLQAEGNRRRKAQLPSLSKEELLEVMIEREALIARAVQIGLDRDPEICRSYENLLIGKLKERELQPRLRDVEVSPAEVKEGKGKTRVPQAPQSRLAILQARTHSRMSSERIAQLSARMNQARELALKLPAGTRNFGDLAVDFSDDQATRYTGGDAGWFQHAPDKYQLPAAVLTAACSLNDAGEITPVIRATNGLYLVRLVERSFAGRMDETADEELARHRLLLQKRKQAEAQFLSESISSASVVRFPKALQEFQFLEPQVAERRTAVPSLPSP
jgi:peptidyl-prolyl cis-trans isomerase C